MILQYAIQFQYTYSDILHNNNILCIAQTGMGLLECDFCPFGDWRVTMTTSRSKTGSARHFVPNSAAKSKVLEHFGLSGTDDRTVANRNVAICRI